MESSTSIQSSSKGHPIKTFLKKHWMDVALSVSVAALGTLGLVSVLNLGVFANLSWSNYLGYGCFVGGGLLILERFFWLKNDKKTDSKQSESSSSEGVETKPDSSEEEKKVGNSEEKQSMKQDCLSYTKEGGRTTKDKLAFQLARAIEEGRKNKKNKDEREFNINVQRTLTQHEVVVDHTITLENVGVRETQGTRSKMEDAHVAEKITINEKEGCLVGVFDGHGDNGKAAKFLKDKLRFKLEANIEQAIAEDETVDFDTIITNALVKTMIELDKHIKKIKDYEGGTTATCALILDNDIYTFNVGDSRTVLVKKEEALQLSEDHNPRRERIKNAIHKMGNYVQLGKVNSCLAVGRDIGMDVVPSRPKITKITAENGDYLVLACDGLWDVCTNSELFAAIKQMEKEGKTLDQMAERLVQTADENKCNDNITVMVVEL